VYTACQHRILRGRARLGRWPGSLGVTDPYAWMSRNPGPVRGDARLVSRVVRIKSLKFARLTRLTRAGLLRHTKIKNGSAW
jgi:hypothetical protein